MFRKKFLPVILAFIIVFTSGAGFSSAIQNQNEKANRLVEMKWIMGRPEGLALNSNITRAEIVQFIITIKGLSDDAKKLANQKSNFTDLPINYWANGQINVISNLGIVSGYPDNTFRPNNYITKEEAISLISRLNENYNNYEKSYNKLGMNRWSDINYDFASDYGLFDDNSDYQNRGNSATRGFVFSFTYNTLKDKIETNNINDLPKNNIPDKTTDITPPQVNTPQTNEERKTPEKTPQKENIKYNTFTIETSSGQKEIEVVLVDSSDEMLNYVNEHRKNNGKNPLKPLTELQDYANLRAIEISHSFSHTRPTGKSCFDGIKGYSYIGENIAAGNSSAKDTFIQWKNSPGHNENMLNSNFTHMAVGHVKAKSSEYGDYWVQFFASKNDNSSYKPNYDYNNEDKKNNNNENTKPQSDINAGNYDISNEMLNLVNEFRSENNIPPLELMTDFQSYAGTRAKELVESFSHTRPNGETCTDPIMNTGRYFTWGENIAAGNEDANSTFIQWKNSPGHRANMLDKDFTHIAIGSYKDPNSTYRYYHVQLFGGMRKNTNTNYTDNSQNKPQDTPHNNDQGISNRKTEYPYLYINVHENLVHELIESKIQVFNGDFSVLTDDNSIRTEFDDFDAMQKFIYEKRGTKIGDIKKIN